MNIIRSLIFVGFVAGSVLGSAQSPPSWEEGLQRLAKLSAAEVGDHNLMYRVVTYSTGEASASVLSDVRMQSLRVGRSHFLKMPEYSVLVQDSIQLMIDSTRRNILLSQVQSRALGNVVMAQLDSLLANKAKVIETGKVTDLDASRYEIALTYKPNLPYKQVLYVVNKKSQQLEKVTMFSAQQQDMVIDASKGVETIMPRTEMFIERKPLASKEAIPRLQDFVELVGKTWKLNPSLEGKFSFTNYTLYKQSVLKNLKQ